MREVERVGEEGDEFEFEFEACVGGVGGGGGGGLWEEARGGGEGSHGCVGHWWEVGLGVVQLVVDVGWGASEVSEP